MMGGCFGDSAQAVLGTTHGLIPARAYLELGPHSRQPGAQRNLTTPPPLPHLHHTATLQQGLLLSMERSRHRGPAGTTDLPKAGLLPLTSNPGCFSPPGSSPGLTWALLEVRTPGQQIGQQARAWEEALAHSGSVTP